MKRKGFTLSELLVALAILGIIATFTIPKILESTNTGRKYTVFKEVIATIDAATYQGLLTGDLLSDNTNTEEYFSGTVNSAKYCFSNAVSNGCFPSGEAAVISTANDGQGMVFHNGAMLIGLQSGGSSTIGCNAFAIDWNGLDGPNTEGDDQIVMTIGIASSFSGLCVAHSPVRGISRPSNSRPVSVALYQEIFSN